MINLQEALQPGRIAAMIFAMSTAELGSLAEVASARGLGLSELRFVIDSLSDDERARLEKLIADVEARFR